MKTNGRSEWTALIVDDEELARQRLRELLEAFPSIQIAGEAGRLTEAKRLVVRLEPDVVFLDIELFGKNGFDLLDDLPEHTRVIFVTAYDEYAIRAFEVNALDYLMKPVDPERLAQAVRRLHPGAAKPDTRAGRLTETDRILLQSGRTRWFEPVSAICSIQAEGDYTEVITTRGGKALFRRSMKEWMNILPEKLFVRAHRNRIINIRCIERMERIGEDRMRLRIRGCACQQEVSRRRLPDLMRRIKNTDEIH